MAEITAALVKDLRTQTGAGMMDCKKALAETNGDMQEAIDWLRKKGLSQAAKKAGRVASEGLVGAALAGQSGLLLEVNAETDFVARAEQFQKFVSNAANLALSKNVDIEELKNLSYPDPSGDNKTVQEYLTSMIATIGENMNLRRLAYLKVNSGVVVSYIHNSVAPNLGKIGVLVALQSSGKTDILLDMGKKIAMHIAAAHPLFLNIAAISPDSLEREKAIIKEKVLASGKPAEMAEKMVEGGLRKYYEEVCLLEQSFVMDPTQKITGVIAALAKELGSEVQLSGFVRMALGEGIEKEEKDFAAEVAAQLGH